MNHRRKFFRQLAGMAGLVAPAVADGSAKLAADPASRGSRLEAALAIRQTAALFESAQSAPSQLSNGDESKLPGYLGCFTKGLPHDSLTKSFGARQN